MVVIVLTAETMANMRSLLETDTVYNMHLACMRHPLLSMSSSEHCHFLKGTATPHLWYMLISRQLSKLEALKSVPNIPGVA